VSTSPVPVAPVVAVAKPRFRGVSHAYALVVAVVAGTGLVVAAPPGEGTVLAGIYSTTLVAMFAVSALYHRGNWSPAAAKRMLQLDHTMIFLLIAGTFTPVLALVVHGSARDALLAVVWLVAALGIAFEWSPIAAPRGYVTGVYLAFGSLGLLAFEPLERDAGLMALALVALGGACYVVGAIVHAARRPDPWPTTFGYHEIFHVFVIVAALLQYLALARYVLPLAA
jgi:hemolysin III